MNPQSDILTGINEFDTLALQRDTQQRLNDLFSSVPDIQKLPDTTMPQVPFGQYGAVGPDVNINLTDEERLRMKHTNEFKQLNKKYEFFGDDIYVKQDDTRRYLDEPYGFRIDRDNEDFYAKQQSWYGEIGKAIFAKLPAYTLTKLGTGVGYLLGLSNPVNWFEDNYIAAASDNVLAKAFGDLEDNLKNDWLTTYQEAVDRDKGFFSRATTDLNFWTEDVTDGAAFLASAFIPGATISKLGLGSKLAAGLGAERALASSNALLKGLGGAATKYADGFLTTALNTASESMFEAKEVKDKIYNDLLKSGKTEKEAQNEAGEKARNSFLANMGVLGFSNAWETNMFFKALGRSKATGTLAETGLEELYSATKETSRIGSLLNSKPAYYIKKSLEGSLVEGFYEENIQLAIQRINEDSTNYSNVLQQFLAQTGDALSGDDKEASMNIGLGALIGGLFGTGISVLSKEYTKDKIESERIVDALNAARNNWTKAGEIYSKDEDGKWKLNNDKVSSVLFSQYNKAQELQDIEGLKDPIKINIAKKGLFASFVGSHIQNSTFDLLMEQLQKLKSKSSEELVKFGFDPDQNSLDQIDEYIRYANRIKGLRDVVDRISTKESKDILRIRKELLYETGARREAVKDEISKVDNQLSKVSVEIGNNSSSDILVEELNLLNAKLKLYQGTLDKTKTEDKDFINSKINNINSEIQKVEKDNEDALKKIKKDNDGFYSFENKDRNNNPLLPEYVDNLIKKANLDNSVDILNNEFDKINSNKEEYVDKIYEEQKKQVEELIKQEQEKELEEKKEEKVEEKKEEVKSNDQEAEDILLNPEGQESKEKEVKKSTVVPLDYDSIKSQIQKSVVNLVSGNKGIHVDNQGKIASIIRKSLLDGTINEEEHDYLMNLLDSFKPVGTPFDTDEDFPEEPSKGDIEEDESKIGDLDNEEELNDQEPGFTPGDPSAPEVNLDPSESLIAWRSSLKTVTQEEAENDNGYSGFLTKDPYVTFKQKFLRNLLKDGNFEDFYGIITKDKPEYPHDERAQSFINGGGELGSVIIITDKQGQPLYFDENYTFTTYPKEGSQLLSYTFTKDYWKDIEDLRAQIGSERKGVPVEDILEQYKEEEKKFTAARELNNQGKNIPISFVGMSAGSLRTGTQMRQSSEVLDKFSKSLLVASTLEGQFVPTFEQRNLVNGGLYAIIQQHSEPDVYVRLYTNKVGDTELYNDIKEFLDYEYEDDQVINEVKDYLDRLLYLSKEGRPLLLPQMKVVEGKDVLKLTLVVDGNEYSSEDAFNFLQDLRINPQRELLENNVLHQLYFDNGILSHKDIDYEQFLLNNSKTNVIPFPTEKGSIIRYLNTYLIFDIDKTSEELQAELTGEVIAIEKRKESPIKSVEEKVDILTREALKKQRKRLADKTEEEKIEEAFKRSEEERRRRDEDSLKARKQEGQYSAITESEISHVNSLFGTEILHKLSDVINSDSWGLWTTSGITLYADAPIGTGYHEAWHHFSQLYLTKKDKRSLYDEVRTRSIDFQSRDGRDLNTREASDLDIEEFIADDFRDYVLSNGKSRLANRPARNSIFRKILDFIKEFFFGRVNIEKLYQELLSENKNQYSPSIDNAFWGKLNAAIKTKDGVELFNNAKASYYRGVMDALVGEELLKRNGSIDRVQSDPSFAAALYESLRRTIYKDYYTPLFNAYEAGENYNVQLLDDLEKLIENWSDVVDYHKVNTRLGYYIDEDLPDVDEDNEEEALEEDEEKYVGEEGDQIEEVKYTDKTFDISGNERPSFDYAYLETKALIRMLPKVVYKNGKFEIEKDINGFPKLNEFSKTWNNLAVELEGGLSYSGMYRRLQDPEVQNKVPESIELLKRLPSPDKIHTKDEINRITKFYQDFNKAYVGIYSGNMVINDKTSFYFTEETKRNRDVIYKIWNNNFLSIPEDSEFIKADYIIYDEENDRFSLNPNQVINFDLSRESGRRDLMNLIGMTFSDQTMDQPAFKQTIRNYLSSIQSNINQRHQAGQIIYNPINDLRKDFKNIKGLGSIISALARFEAKFNTESPSLSYQTAEGEMIYGLMLNNYLTTSIHILNNVPNYDVIEGLPELQHLNYKNNPYVKNSIFLNTLFNLETGKRNPNTSLILGNYNGLKVTGDFNTANSTTSLNTRQKIILDMNSLLTRGAVEIMRTESSSSAYFLRLTNYKNGTYLPVKIENVKSGFRSVEFLNIMTGYLRDELYRMQNTDKMDVTDKIKNSAKDFHLFRDILNKSKLKEKLKDNIKLELKTKSIEDIISNNYRGIEEAIINFFEKEHMSFLQLMESENITDKDMDSSLIEKYNPNQLSRAFVVNDFILNVEYTKLISGDLIYQADFKDYFKRSKGDISTGRRPMVEQFFTNYMKSIEKATFAGFLGYTHMNDYKRVRTAVIRDNKIISSYVSKGIMEKNIKAVHPNISESELKTILDKYSDVNVADGQGHITLDFYRQFLISIGNWSDAQEYAYRYELLKFRVANSTLGVDYDQDSLDRDLQRIADYESYLVENNKTTISYFPPLKIQYNGPLETQGTFAPVMDKFSVAPLIPSLIRGTNWEKINIDLIKNGIGYTKFESGTKKYKHEATTMYNPDGSVSIDFSKYEPAKHFLIYLKEQINTKPSIKTESIFGSQVRKLILANIFDKGQASEKWVKRYETYKSLLKANTALEKQILLEDLGVSINKDNLLVIEDMKKFIEKVQEQANLRQLNDNIKDYVQYDKDTKNFKFPLETSLNRSPIQDLVMGMIDRSLRRQKVNGDMLIQISSSGFENPNFNYTNATEEDIRKYGSNGLKFYDLEYDENGKPIRTTAMQVKVGLNGGFESLLNLNHPDGNKIGSLERLNELIKNDEWRKTHKSFITLIGYRIPTQGMNSIEMMEVAEFLPSIIGSSIILPAEIVVKSGSDYDIDKMSIFRPSFHSSGRLLVEKQSTSDLEKGRLTNEIISLFGDILSDPDLFMQLITPNNNDKVKPLSVEIAESLGRRQNVYQATQVLRYKNNLRKFESLLSGKKLLGIFAVNNTFNQIIQQTGVDANQWYGRNKAKQVKLFFFSPAEKAKILSGNKILISNREDVEGNLKQDYFSQLINATVDIASDDYIGYVNLNRENAGVLCWLINLGVPLDRAMWFLNQPVLLKYYFDLRSKAGEKSKSTIKAELLTELGVKGLFNDIEGGFRIVNFNAMDKAITMILADPKIPQTFYLSANALKKRVIRDYNDAIKGDEAYQRIVFAYFLSLQEQAQNFREFQSVLNFDTTKFQTVIDAVKSISNETKISDPKRGSNNLFDRSEIDKVAKDSIISPFNNKRLTYQIMASIMPAGTDAKFLVAAGEVIDRIYNRNLKQRASRSLSNDWIEFIIKNMAEYNKNNMKYYYYSFLQGKNSLARRLIKIKRQYPDLVKQYYIFERLKSNFSTDTKIKNQNIQIDRIFENTVDDQNKYIEEFRELINFNDSNYNPEQLYEIKSLFKDIALVAFLQSGFSKSNISFQELVPYEQFAEVFARALNLYTERIKSDQNLRELFIKNFITKFKEFNPTALGRSSKGKQYWRGKPYFVDEIVYPELGKVLPKSGDPTVLTKKPVKEAPKLPSVPNTVAKPINTDIQAVSTFTRESVQKDSNYIYLFTDNAKRTSGNNKIKPNWYTDKYGIEGNYPTQTQAIIRGLENAFPITTMVDDKRTQWTDDKFDEYKKIIDDEIDEIKDSIQDGIFVGIKFANQTPFGKGKISNMKESAPKIWNYLNQKLREIGIDNTGEKPVAFKSNVEVHPKEEKDVIESPISNKSDDLREEQDVVDEGIKNSYLNHSGGAQGADLTWDRIGKEYGFNNHKHYRPEDLNSASEELKKKINIDVSNAAKRLGRPTGEFRGKDLVRRNWFQVNGADEIFAVSRIVESGALDKGYVNKAKKQVVSGGTGWAVEMAIQKGKPVHVYDMNTQSWYKWNAMTNKFEKEDTPVLTQNYAGIGSRELDTNGIKAIRDVYKRTSSELSIPVPIIENIENKGIKVKDYPIPSKENIPLTKTTSLDVDIKAAEEKYLRQWIENNERYYIPIPKDKWNLDDLDEYYRKKGTRITMDNLQDALKQNEALGDQISDNADPNKGRIDSVFNSKEDYIEVPLGKSQSVEIKNFKSVIDEYKNDKFDEEEKPYVEKFLSEYGLSKYLNIEIATYNPNQLSLFQDEEINKVLNQKDKNC